MKIKLVNINVLGQQPMAMPSPEQKSDWLHAGNIVCKKLRMR